MKRIVLFQGGVETLDFFSWEMGKTFTELGYAVFFYDLKNEAYSSRKLRKFLKPGVTAMVTFNFEGLDREPGVYREGEGYIWDAYRIPCYNIAADHPYYYHEKLKYLPARYYHISIDRFHQSYFKTYYPEYREAGFLPLAGTGAPQEEGAELLEADRPYGILLTGNYTPPSFCEPYIHGINEEYAAFYQGIIDELLKHPGQTVEETALRHCERELGSVDPGDLRQVFHRMVFIDLYVRNYWRGNVVRTLVDAGLPVDVVGKGWEALSCLHPENLRIHPQTDSASCLAMLAKARLSVNVMPWFKDGAHDRVFSSILNGAVCLTDESGYLCEELKDGEGVCYYDLKHLNALPKMALELLGDEEKRRTSIRRGAAKAGEKHLWKHRAGRLAAWMEENCAKDPGK